MAAVIILSVLLVAAIIAVVFGFVRQYRLYRQNHAVAAPASLPASAAIQLAPGSHIISAASSDGKLTLHVTTPQGSEVDIFDLATGQRTAQIKDGS